MKKILFTLIIFLSIFQVTNASFWMQDDLDLYYSIEEQIDEIQLKTYVIENNWLKDFKDQVNKHLKSSWETKCKIDKKMSQNDILAITNWDISKLKNLAWKKCFDKEDSISNENIAKLINSINFINNQNKARAKSKTDQMQTISSIWIYNDWTLDNSSFDLISDIKDIDNALFASETEYEWLEDFEVDTYFNDFTDLLDNSIYDLYQEDDETAVWNSTNSNSIWKAINYSDINISSQLICNIDNSNAWLTPEELSDTLNNLSTPIIDEVLEYDESIEIENKTDLWEKIKWSDYASISDDYPCNNFFCIEINFIMYTHNLLWWAEKISVESIIARSNKHLKKMLSVPLSQSEMSLNNFELWLKWLDLPSLFHLWFVVTEKPVPILDVRNKNDNKEDEEYLVKNQLEKYYKSYWLDYQRRNDLSLITWIEKNKQSTLSSKSLSNKNAMDKFEKKDDYTFERAQEAEFYSNTIANKASYQIFWNFHEQFVELEKFTETMASYVQNIDTVITNMITEIPQL